MFLCMDVGNSQIYAGVFDNEKVVFRFRYSTQENVSSDQLGIFFRTVLNENNINPDDIEQIAICSVVPNLDYSLRSACRKYFSRQPFMLKAGVKTGLKINYRNPLEVGADRIANAIAGVEQFPNRDLLLVDFGTATTFCAVSAEKVYLGGVILPGMRLSMDALQRNTAKLSPVEIIKPQSMLGRSTMESIQSGLFYGQLAAVKEVVQGLTGNTFKGNKPIIIGTGGLAYLFEQEYLDDEQRLFDAIEPDLVLQGLKSALEMNEL